MSPTINEYSARVGVDRAQQSARWISELVFFQNPIERNVFAMMAELAIRHVEHDSVVDFCPVSVVWQEDKLRVSIDELFDEPWASYAIHFNFLASDPFHKLDSCLVAAWFWYAIVAAI